MHQQLFCWAKRAIKDEDTFTSSQRPPYLVPAAGQPQGVNGLGEALEVGKARGVDNGVAVLVVEVVVRALAQKKKPHVKIKELCTLFYSSFYVLPAIVNANVLSPEKI